ncbi:hypothetical protein [Micromonospora sp. NPDC005173]|uniref:hypothetical protein n=1 Tax=Micromonospora sp. NPDC005173 TaxID=3157165 RepID=UPI0033AA185E
MVQITRAELGAPGGDDPAVLEHGHLAELGADVGEQQRAGTDGTRAYCRRRAAARARARR